MFYSQIILAKKGPLGKIWIAAHWDKKLNKAQIFQTNINTSVENIKEPTVPLALRVSGHLLLGLVRIYSRKVRYLMSDANEALTKIQMAFRPGATDLPAGSTTVASGVINDERWGDFDDVRMDGDIMVDAFNSSYDVDKWLEAAPANFARGASVSISGDASENASLTSGQDRSGSFMLDGGEISWANLSDSGLGTGRSRVSDIEAVRDADHSGLRSDRLSVSMDVMSIEKENAEGQMFGYDDLGPPTHPNELALDADLDVARDADFGERDEGMMDEANDLAAASELDAPEFNDDLATGGQALDEELPGAVQLDDDTLNLDEADFSRADGAADEAAEESRQGLEDRAERGGTGDSAAIDRELGDVKDDEDEEEDDEEEAIVKKPKTTRSRKRKLVVNQVTLIDMNTMKAQFEDCSDIVRKRRRGRRRVGREALPPEEQLAAPLMPWMAPRLQDMLRSCMTPGGLPFPVRMRDVEEGAQGPEKEDPRGAEEEGGEDTGPVPTQSEVVQRADDSGVRGSGLNDDEIELTRRADDSRQSLALGSGGASVNDVSVNSALQDVGAADSAEVSRARHSRGDLDNFELGGEDLEMDLELGGGLADEGAEGSGLNLDEELPPEIEDEAGLELGGGVDDLGEHEGSLFRRESDVEDTAAVRADGGEEAGEEGEEEGVESGEAGALPRHKWHPHTVKVLKLVRKQLDAGRGAAPESSVTHASITRGATRRTAAGAFFELLQLKTWDFVELSQEDPFGDINVTAGPRLHEDQRARSDA